MQPLSDAPGSEPACRATDIAIVGIAGRFPGAPDLDCYWQNIRDGIDSTSEVPSDHWDIDAHYDPDPRTPNKTHCRRGGFLDGIHDFAPRFFHLSPREAASIDPQQRLFLEVAWEAVEDAGYGGASLRGTRTGVYVGVSSNEYMQSLVARQVEMSPYIGTGNSFSIIANRVSYHLDLHGPSLAVDTACSSSLMALHLACQGLVHGETDHALVGGVNLSFLAAKYIFFSKAGMLSPDGHCRSFDVSANGYVPGEGVGAVLLKPLAAALRDRDTVHGVIRATGVNQDGRTNGITVPSPRAQRELCQEVYERFGIDPSTISYLEAHGTGTPLGDPIEVSALAQAFGRLTDRKQFCGIGTVKTNIGHLEPAAGIAGLLKVLLAFRHRELPPTLFFDEVNPHIRFEETPFYVVDRPRPWGSTGPRRAAVSAFSFGGVNAHVVLEEAPVPVPSPSTSDGWQTQVVTLSAMTDTALAQIERRLAQHLAAPGALRLADLAFTLNAGREHFERRSAYVVGSLDELRAALARGERPAPAGPQSRRSARQPAFLLTGQAADAPAALLGLSAVEPDVRALIEQAEATVGPLSAAGALFVLQVALARLWRAWGIAPQIVAAEGASAVAAAVIDGSVSFEDGLCQLADPADGLGDVVPPPQLPTPEQLSADAYVVVPLGPDEAGERRLAQLAAEVYLAGLDLDWRVWHRRDGSGRVPLPTYPFERQHIEPPLGAPPTPPAGVVAPEVGPPPLVPGLFHEVRWQARPLPASTLGGGQTYVLFAGEAIAGPLADGLRVNGSAVIQVLPGPDYAEEGPDLFRINPSSAGDHVGLVAALQDRGIEPSFIHLWGCTDRDDLLGDPDLLERRLTRGTYSILFLAQAMASRRLRGPLALWVASTDSQAVGRGHVQAENAAAHGLMRTLGLEYPQFGCVHVDLPGDESAEALAAILLAEIAGGAADRLVAYRGGERLVPDLVPLPSDVPRAGPVLRERGVYWITGGLGGLGRLVARHLAERFRARLVLTARTPLLPRERWAEYLASCPADDPLGQVIRDLREIEALGSEVLVLEADVAETWQLRRALRQVLDRFGVVNGVFHAAGVLRDGLVRGKEIGTFREVLRPKVRGSLCLERVLDGQPLDCFVLFSSIASVTGSIGQSDYSAANAFMDALAHRRRAAGRPYVSLNWSLWADGGMRAEHPQAMKARGLEPLDSATATRALEQALSLGRAQFVIARFTDRPALDARPIAAPAEQPAVAPHDLSVVALPDRPVMVLPNLSPLPEPATQPDEARVEQPFIGQPSPLAPRPVPVRAFAEEWLVGLIAPRLGVEMDQIEVDRPFLELGIDSIIAGELVLDAEDQLPITLSPTLLFDYPTVAEFAGYLCDQHEAAMLRLREKLGARAAGSYPSNGTAVERGRQDEAEQATSSGSGAMPEPAPFRPVVAPSGPAIVRAESYPRVAFLFTGQGAQYQRMAESLYQTEPTFRHDLEQCNEILRPHLDRTLLDLLYPADGRPSPLDQTIYTQPVTVALGYCLAQLWRSWGVEPAAVLGHSVGEYAAACLAGVLPLEEVLPLVARRARLMQSLPGGGAMLAVRADEALIRAWIGRAPNVSIAALNGPRNVVLSGEADALARLAEELQASGIRSTRLAVSHAFHSALMEPILESFRACFDVVSLRAPRLPLVANVSGGPAGAEIATSDYWLRQLRQPVRFADGMQALVADGIDVFLEVGPGQTLVGLAREIVAGGGRQSQMEGDRVPLLLPSLVRGQEDWDVLGTSATQLSMRGVEIDLQRLRPEGRAAPPSAPRASASGPSFQDPTRGIDTGRSEWADGEELWVPERDDHQTEQYQSIDLSRMDRPAAASNGDENARVRRLLDALRQGQLSARDAVAELVPDGATVPDWTP